ncbi:MAG: ion transporter, partial [Pseudomonadota bacterium]
MGFRERLGAFVDHPGFGRFITGVIIVNAILLGMDTSPTLMDRFGFLIENLDQVCLGIFIVEIAMKLISRGWRFFT